MDSEKSQSQMWKMLSEMKAELEGYRAEVQALRQQLDANQQLTGMQIDSAKFHSPTSRRRALKHMVAGAAGVGLLSFAAINGTVNTAFAENQGDNAIQATPGGQGYAGRFDDGGLANIYLKPSGSAAFVTGTHQVGELYVNSAGDLFYCVVAGSETTSKWRKIAGPATSGALHLLASPARFVDTRPAPNQLNDPAGAYGNGVTRTYTITSLTGSGGATIPAGAAGITGNITIVGPGAGGFAQLYAGSPTTSTVNWNAGADTANGFTVGLSSTGQVKLTVYFYAAATANVIIDIAGYYL